MANQFRSERAEHCKDCCCARSWKALGITDYTGKSIPEHIEQLREKVQTLERDYVIAYTMRDDHAKQLDMVLPIRVKLEAQVQTLVDALERIHVTGASSNTEVQRNAWRIAEDALAKLKGK